MATRGNQKSPSRRLDAEARRTQLVDCALGVFARRGYNGAGTRELARAAGVTEPILYRHFDTKAGLFQAVLALVERRLVDALDQAAAGARSARARLEALASHLPDILERCRDDLRVLNAAALTHEEPEILAAAGRCAGGVGAALAGMFRGSGLRRGIDAGTAGFLLLEVGMGAAMLSPLELPAIAGPRFRNTVVQALLRGIASGS